jgi:flagellar assembly protein FliH
MAAQLAPLVAAFDQAFIDMESQIADGVARTATALARQVLRSELAARPELVAQVAAEAVNAVLLSARHIRVFVHPDDLPLVETGAGEALAARSARLQADASLARGGARVESDLGVIDARIEARWAQAAAMLGQTLPLNDGDAAA